MGLKKYTARRLLTGFITILVVLSAIYFIFRLPSYVLGMSPAELYTKQLVRGSQKYNVNVSKVRERLEEQMGIPGEDASIAERAKFFFVYLFNMVTFNFGKTTVPPFQPVTQVLLNRLPYTLLLLGPTTFLQILIGINLGVQAGKGVGSKKDKGLVIFGLSTRSLPSYWVQMLAIFVFVYILGVYPAALGPTPPGFSYREPFFKIMAMLYMFSLPIATLVFSGFGAWIYLTRNSLADVITEDYIFTARAKGLPESTVVYKHALRNAILPIWTNIVLALAYMWTGVVITETIFNISGVGQLLIHSIFVRDYALEQLIFYFIALSVIGANIVADVSYGILDPRVSYES